MNKYHAIRVNGKKVDEHRIVAIRIFGEDAVRGKDVHHKNGDKSDNRPENLEVLTRSEHIRLHYSEMGDEAYFKRQSFIDRQRENGKKRAEQNKINYGKRVGQFTKDGVLVRSFRTAREVDLFGFQNPHVITWCNGLRKTHKGFIWKYI